MATGYGQKIVHHWCCREKGKSVEKLAVCDFSYLMALRSSDKIVAWETFTVDLMAE